MTVGLSVPGLGLAIAESIVEAHGGAISLTVAPGRGCHVRITLPRRAPPGVRLPSCG